MDRTPLKITKPTFDGPETHALNRVMVSVPPGSTVLTSLTGAEGVVYVITPDGAVHLCRRREDGGTEEVKIPPELLGGIRRRLGL